MTSTNNRTSKNSVTIDQLVLACRHVEELTAIGVTSNMAIRTLELFADVYAKLHMGGSATPHHVRQVKLWSAQAIQQRDRIPGLKPKNYFRVEHGTPRRSFALMVLALYRKGTLNPKTMDKLVKRYWKLAVITVDEDIRLNKIARSKAFKTPEERWAAAEILFNE